jgi:MazG family protein
MADSLKNGMSLKNTKDLLETMRVLRDPRQGCAWNRDQNFKSLAPYTLEEAYEVVDAINEGDYNKLKDELGDLLLQVVFQAQVAEERGLFTFEDVAASINDKMIRRHTHVFGDDTAQTPEEVNKKWEDNKAIERANENKKSVLDDVAKALPALTRAEKISKRAVRVGFEWPDYQGVMDKVLEEFEEFRVEVERDDQQKKHEEFGDILFTLVNIARWQSIDPEASLRDANDKFEWRFRYMEEHAGKPVEHLSMEEFEVLWQQAKQAEQT